MVVPTTLLARQHFKNFSERFRGFPVNVRAVVAAVPAAQMTLNKKGLADGSVDIDVGTHAVLGKAIKFKDLGLVVVDEEQHFGVSHKERLKTFARRGACVDADGDAIPRTLQLALTGVRESVDHRFPSGRSSGGAHFRHAFDPLVVREALLREKIVAARLSMSVAHR